MKKKIIIVCIFLILIITTAIYTVVSAVNSYHYDMDPANGVDILEGFDAVLIMMVGGFVVFYELDLFYTVYYFFISPKSLIKSIIVILSNVALLLIFFTDHIINFWERYVPNILATPLEDGIIPIGLFLIYVVLKIVCFNIGSFAKEN